MGLSIHYRLSLSPEKDVPGLANLPAHWAVEDARTLALKMKRRGAFDAVGPLCWDAEARKRATDWLCKLMHGEPRVPVPGQPRRVADVEIRPSEGRAFCIDVGHDCEPLWIGLCR